MEWAKVKNIIILILLTANVLLLGLLTWRESASRAQRSALLSDAVAILAENGIRLEESLVPAGDPAAAFSMERDTGLEAALAESLLGPCQAETAGATHTYVSTSGSAIFRGTGDFVMTFTAQGAPRAEGDLASHGTALLREAGLAFQPTEIDHQGDRTQVLLFQLWNDLPVFTCQVTLTYEGSALTSLQGRRLLADQGQRLSEAALSAPTVLVRFLSSILAGGEVCNEILAIQPGYQMTVSLTGPATLRPVWRLATDTGRFQVDLTTGEATRVA